MKCVTGTFLRFIEANYCFVEANYCKQNYVCLTSVFKNNNNYSNSLFTINHRQETEKN